jgi:endoglucanase
MDEIALMVSDIVDAHGNGFLRVTKVGGIDIRQLYGLRVTVHGQRNVRGVLGGLPASLLPDDRRSKAYGFEDLVVDVGLSAESTRKLISIGDFVTFQQPVYELLNGRLAAKALDNRASVAAVTVALEALQGQTHAWDVVAVATAQEETGLLGAYTAAFAQRPDAAVALDVSFAKGPGVSDANTFELGQGPILDIGVNVHPGMFKALQDSAEKLEMTVHVSPHMRSSGTDAAGTQVARDGVPTGLISIPIRAMHTVVETVAAKDIERAGRWLAAFITDLPADFVAGLTAAMMD